MVAVSLDLRRAFETVNRDLLLEKLRRCGFCDGGLNVICLVELMLQKLIM